MAPINVIPQQRFVSILSDKCRLQSALNILSWRLHSLSSDCIDIVSSIVSASHILDYIPSMADAAKEDATKQRIITHMNGDHQDSVR